MANRCEVCGKEVMFGKNVSHSHRKSNRRFKVNTQKVKATVNGETKNLTVCTSCIKANKVQKAV